MCHASPAYCQLRQLFSEIYKVVQSLQSQNQPQAFMIVESRVSKTVLVENQSFCIGFQFSKAVHLLMTKIFRMWLGNDN